MNSKVFAAGELVVGCRHLREVVDALNYLRTCCDVKVDIAGGSRYLENDHDKIKVRLLFGLHANAARLNEELATVQRVLDVADEVRTTVVKPVASSPESMRLARRAASISSESEIPFERLLPEESRSRPFDGLVGMDRQIALVRSLGDAVAAYGRSSLESLHMVFTGPPGVGKTELAHRYARYLGDAGVTNGKAVAVSASELISPHVGETPALVSQAFDRADRGVLFIDEAYSLTAGESNSFGVEAVNALVRCLDERRRRVIVIAAGYPDEMALFLKQNPGLAGRFGFQVDFDPMPPALLADVFLSFSAEHRFDIENGIKEILVPYLERLECTEGFAYARTVRKLHDRCVLAAARCHPDRRGFDVSDVEAEAEKLIEEMGGMQKRTAVGFV